jgi:hypothetical protein
VAEQGVDARGVDRHPSDGLRRIAHDARTDRAGGVTDRVEVGDVAARRLHERERDEVDVVRDRVGQSRQRGGANPDAAAGVHEGQDQRRELVFGHEHRRLGRQCCDQQRQLHRRLRADRDARGIDAHEDANVLAMPRPRGCTRDVGVPARSAVTARAWRASAAPPCTRRGSPRPCRTRHAAR